MSYNSVLMMDDDDDDGDGDADGDDRRETMSYNSVLLACMKQRDGSARAARELLDEVLPTG